MKLKEAIASETRGHYGCGVAALIATLPKPDATDLLDCLNDRQYSAPAIMRGLKAEGHTLSDGQIKRHRNHECNCAQ